MSVKSIQAHVLVVGVNEMGEVLVREGQGPMSCHLVAEANEDLLAHQVWLRPDAVLKGHVVASAVHAAPAADEERLLEGRTMAQWYMEAKQLKARVEELEEGAEADDAKMQADDSTRKSMVEAHARKVAEMEEEDRRLRKALRAKCREAEKLDALLGERIRAQLFLHRIVEGFLTLVEAKSALSPTDAAAAFKGRPSVEDIVREAMRGPAEESA